MKDHSPYARIWGIVLVNGDSDTRCKMSYAETVAGLVGLHGGAISALLELAARAALDRESNPTRESRLVSLSVDYLRAGQPEDAFASAHIFRQGRRFADVHAESWQGDRSRVIAVARAVFTYDE